MHIRTCRCTSVPVFVGNERLDENIKCEECSAMAGGLQQELMSLMKTRQGELFSNMLVVSGRESVCVLGCLLCDLWNMVISYIISTMWQYKTKREENKRDKM